MLDKRTWRKHVPLLALSAALAAAPAGTIGADQEAAGSDQAEVARLRAEIEDLKTQLRALKQQVDALARGAAEGAAPAVAAPPATAGIPEAASAPPPAPRGGPASASVFNPAISAVFQGIGSGSINHDRDDDGFSLSEAEVGLQAAVDPYARVDLFLAFNSEGEAEVEEGFVTFTAMPGGLQARAGRFKSAFGKWNVLHDHQFLSVDRPDALIHLFGDEGLVSDGASLSWLVPGTGPVYLETVTEIGSTGNDVSFDARRRDFLYTQRIDSLFTLGSEATIGVGLSAAAGRAGPTERLLEEIDGAGLAGTLEPDDRLASNVFGLDVTYKWKPVQQGLYRSFAWQSELFETRRRVQSLDPAGTLVRDTVRSLGLYSHAEYQFAKRWRAGLRYDWSELPDDEDARSQALSAVMRIQPTEFQEFRIQFKHTGRDGAAASRFDDVRSDNEVFVEWIPVIGAHAAHKY